METSLRYGGEERHLRLHAKETFELDKTVSLRVHASLDTHSSGVGARAHLGRRFFVDGGSSLLDARVDVGARFDSDRRTMTYEGRAKKSVPLSDGGIVSLDLCGGYAFDPVAKVGLPRATAAVTARIFNVTDVQDLRVRVGLDLVGQTPFLQLRENNWTFNASTATGWNIIYDL